MERLDIDLEAADVEASMGLVASYFPGWLGLLELDSLPFLFSSSLKLICCGVVCV